MIRVHMGRHPKARHVASRHGVKPKKPHYPHRAQASAGVQARRTEHKGRPHIGALAKSKG